MAKQYLEVSFDVLNQKYGEFIKNEFMNLLIEVFDNYYRIEEKQFYSRDVQFTRDVYCGYAVNENALSRLAVPFGVIVKDSFENMMNEQLSLMNEEDMNGATLFMYIINGEVFTIRSPLKKHIFKSEDSTSYFS